MSSLLIRARQPYGLAFGEVRANDDSITCRLPVPCDDGRADEATEWIVRLPTESSDAARFANLFRAMFGDLGSAVDAEIAKHGGCAAVRKFQTRLDDGVLIVSVDAMFSDNTSQEIRLTYDASLFELSKLEVDAKQQKAAADDVHQDCNEQTVG